MFRKKTFGALLAMGVLGVVCFLAPVGPVVAAEQEPDGFIAIVYSATGFRGFSWQISKPGKYPLGREYQFPNDSINSVRIAPGYEIVLHEDADFQGNQKIYWSDGSRVGFRRPSSLEIVEKGPLNQEEIAAWRAKALAVEKEEREVIRGYQVASSVGDIIAGDAKLFETVTQNNSQYWYGELDDAGRVELAGSMLALFGQLGYDDEIEFDEWTANSFAQQLNNYYDWDYGHSIWEGACAALGIQADWYVDIYKNHSPSE